MKKAIKTSSGAILGWIQDSATGNGDQVAFTETGRLLGFYKKLSDITTDDAGKIVYRGNALAALIINKGRIV